MTSLDPSHLPHLAAREKHIGDPATVHTHTSRSRSGSGSSAKHVAVPDLRFERSYLKSISPYVKTRRVAGAAGDAGDADAAREVMNIEWKKVAWITMRDQLVSPLLQGALWGVAQLFIRPLAANIRAFFGFGKRVPASDSPSKPKSEEGELTRRLREWSKELKGGLEPNIALAK